MKHNIDIFIDIFKENYQEGNIVSFENAISAMKDAGASMVNSVRVISKVLNIPFSDADEMVLNAHAWEKERQGIENFRKDIAKTLLDISDRHGEDWVEFDL